MRLSYLWTFITLILTRALDYNELLSKFQLIFTNLGEKFVGGYFLTSFSILIIIKLSRFYESFSYGNEQVSFLTFLDLTSASRFILSTFTDWYEVELALVTSLTNKFDDIINKTGDL